MGTDNSAGTGERLAQRTDTGADAKDEKASLELEIERTREQLGDTVERLAAKADVKAVASKKATELSERAKAKTGQVGRQVRDRVTATTGPLWQATPDPVKEVVAKGATGARQRRIPLAVAAGVLIVGYLVVRRRRSR